MHFVAKCWAIENFTLRKMKKNCKCKKKIKKKKGEFKKWLKKTGKKGMANKIILAIIFVLIVQPSMAVQNNFSFLHEVVRSWPNEQLAGKKSKLRQTIKCITTLKSQHGNWPLSYYCFISSSLTDRISFILIAITDNTRWTHSCNKRNGSCLLQKGRKKWFVSCQQFTWFNEYAESFAL